MPKTVPMLQWNNRVIAADHGQNY